MWRDVPAGTWQVVSLPGSEVVAADALPVQVRTGETSLVSLVLTRAAGIHVRVEDGAGSPVAGASLRIVGPLPDGLTLESADPSELPGLTSWQRTTDADGSARVLGVAPDAWFGVHAWTEDGARATGRVRAQIGSGEADVLTLVPPVEVLVRLVDGQTLAPVPDVRVVVIDHRLVALRGLRQSRDVEVLRASEATDVNGEVRVACEAGAWLLARSAVSALCTLQISDRIVAAGEVTLVLDRVDSDRLRVTTADGRPVIGAVVEGTWWFFDAAQRAEGALNSVTTDARGEFLLSALGELPGTIPGGINLSASHPQEGIGGLHVSIENLPPLVQAEAGEAPMPKTIVVRPVGALELQFATTGWPKPPPVAIDPRWTRDDLAEQDAASGALDVTLRYLGSSALRSELSRHHGDRRAVALQEPGDDVSLSWDALEPGAYAAVVRCRAAGLVFSTPRLWVRSGETTVHWAAPPAAALFATVTLDVGAAGALGDALTGRNMAALRAEIAPGYEAGAAIPQSVIAGVGGETSVPVPPDGRVTFPWVSPGRYRIGLWLPDAAKAAGERTWRESKVFALGPGDDLLLSTLHQAPLSAGGTYVVETR